MKILLVSPLPPPAGGIRTVTGNLLNFIRASKNGIDLTVCNTTHRFRPETSESMIIRIFSGIQNAVEIICKVEKTIKEEKPDIIHLSSSSSLALLKDFMILRKAKYSGIPVVMHWHFGRIPELKKHGNWEWKLLLNVIRRSAHSIVIDQKSYNALVDEGCRNVVYVPNPLAADVAQKARDYYLNSYRHRQERIIYVGHIIKSKGVLELVEACSKLPKVKELVLIGEHEENSKKELIRIAQYRQKGNWLKFTGPVDKNEVLEYMAQSSLLVLPSYTEGFPMVIVEAMAMGCPVVATDVGAIPEMLAINTNRPCGVCVPPRNVDKLRDAISNLADNPSQMEILGKRGIELVLENYAIDKVFEKFRYVWEAVLGSKSVS